MTIGEPRHGAPAWIGDILARHGADWGRYPPITGTPELREAIAAWVQRRYGVTLDAGRAVLPLAGSREGLFAAAFVARDRRPDIAAPAIAMPNPFYQAYVAGALAAGTEPVFLPATATTGFLPDLAAIPPGIAARLVALYINSPANPQGAVASGDYLRQAIKLARTHDFMLFVDECYSEIWQGAQPAGALAALGDEPGNLAVFNSLSKRSSAPGLRSGFVAGDSRFIAAFGQFRNVACPQMPLPVQAASAALWADEAHVAASRAAYAEKIADATRQLGGTPGFRAPAAGFFLWLETAQIGGGAAAAKTFWKHCGVKVLPGATLAQADDAAINPGADYVRIALVDSLQTTSEALARIKPFLA